MPLPEFELPAPWVLLGRDRLRTQTRLKVQGDMDEITVVFTRCLSSELRDAYPVSAHDIDVQVLANDLPHPELTRLLGDVVSSVERGDPQCRRIVFPAPAGDLDVVRAAEATGFRFVVDVDLADRELTLLVAEPAWVTHVDMDLDRVPES